MAKAGKKGITRREFVKAAGIGAVAMGVAPTLLFPRGGRVREQPAGDSVYPASASVRRALRYSFLGSAQEEQRRIVAALEACRGNKTRAAEMLGMARNTLRAKLREAAAAGLGPELTAR